MSHNWSAESKRVTLNREVNNWAMVLNAGLPSIPRNRPMPCHLQMINTCMCFSFYHILLFVYILHLYECAILSPVTPSFPRGSYNRI